MNLDSFGEFPLGIVENVVEIYEPVHDTLIDEGNDFSEETIDTGYITMALSASSEDYSGGDEALRTSVNRVLGVMASQDLLDIEGERVCVDSSSWSVKAYHESYKPDESLEFYRNLKKLYQSESKNKKPGEFVDLDDTKR